MTDNESSPPLARWRKLRTVGIPLVILAMLGFIFWNAMRQEAVEELPPDRGVPAQDPLDAPLPPPDQTSTDSTSLTLPDSAVPPDELSTEQIEKIVVGAWKSEYYGDRYLTVRDDGTATIYFHANAFASMFVGSKLKIEYNWSYEPARQHVVFKIVGGGPAKSLEYVKKMWGSEQRQIVAKLSKSELHLVDLDGETKHLWKHLEEIPRNVLATLSK
ncbi:hypothetical protein [Rubinisphaera margarita]|uniref:hypothetical protein n=1 Tax=Rubinisphaera margarita TaxID=2909586 RepID=UPI001EE9106D|nr:hypothetical protein [Rubinisphaera margarita]MCG6157379.1 hypothetical protein [Rubinisphaera margarita]